MLGHDVAVHLESLIQDPWGYVALGHIHKHHNLTATMPALPPVVYSGSLERIDFGEERERKGFCWVELRRGAGRLREKLNQTESEIAAIHARLEVISGKGQDLKERLAQVQSVEGGDCPLCNQPLTEQGKSDLIAQIEADIHERRESYAAQRTATTTKRADAEATLEQLQSRNETLESLARLESEKCLQLDSLRAEVHTLTQQIAIKQQELNAIEASKNRMAQLETRLLTLQHEHGLYLELREAFCKNGVPAFIIETAKPELETEANELLGRMTDGLMSIRLHTQREKITGGTAETFDIEIQDELGPRSYDIFSGGEAFRINLALRIALSKVLAKGAGARLRALFIDEGFGSQDGGGHSKLVEAINRILDDAESRTTHPASLILQASPADEACGSSLIAGCGGIFRLRLGRHRCSRN